jgi:chromate transporter
MTDAQLMDAVADGQITPGPVFSTATFIGYLLAGVRGAVAATVAIFLPGLLLVIAIRPLVHQIRNSPAWSAFLDGVNVAALALMALVSAELARSAVVDALTAAVAVLSAILLIAFRINSTWLIAAGALVGSFAR